MHECKGEGSRLDVNFGGDLEHRFEADAFLADVSVALGLGAVADVADGA
jgi:hypothetical protein